MTAAGRSGHFRWLKKYTVILGHWESLAGPRDDGLWVRAHVHTLCTREETGRATYRPNHFADQDDGGPPSRARRQDPATVQLKQELRTGVDVNAGPVLPAGVRDGGPGHSVSGAHRTRPKQARRRAQTALKQRQVETWS